LTLKETIPNSMSRPVIEVMTDLTLTPRTGS